MLFGGVGLGKTHLAQAIGNENQRLYGNKTVLYVTSDKFTNQFIDALKNNAINDFVHFYQLIDVLIMDDIQFFANKLKTQDIFFTSSITSTKWEAIDHDFSTVLQEILKMEERLLGRFRWGLSADLQQPDFESIAILEKKMYSDGIELSRDVIEFVAYNINSNVRELEGALISLLAQSSLNNKEVDLDLAKKIIKNFVKSVSREVSIDYIQKTVCEFFEVPQEQLKEKTRKRAIVQARQLSMFLAKSYTKNSLKVIGKHFGGRDHNAQ